MEGANMTEYEKIRLRTIRAKVVSARDKATEPLKTLLLDIEEGISALLKPTESKPEVQAKVSVQPAEDPFRVRKDYVVGYSVRTHNWVVTSMGEIVATADSFAEANAIADTLRKE